MLLLLYCKKRSVAYTQGLNELLAPFFVLDMTREQRFNAFYALVTKFLPNTFRGSDLGILGNSFVIQQLLLQYHDPELSAIFEQVKDGIFREVVPRC